MSIDQPEALRALDFLKRSLGTISPTAVTTYAEEDTRTLFQNDRAVFLRNWPYVWTAMAQSPLRKEGRVGMAPVVHAPGQRSAATLGGWGFAISKFTRNPEAAWQLVQYLTSRDQLREDPVKDGKDSGSPKYVATRVRANPRIRKDAAGNTRICPGIGHPPTMAERSADRSCRSGGSFEEGGSRNPIALEDWAVKKPSRSFVPELAWFAPAAVLLLVMVVYPVFRTIGLSFFHKNLLTGFASQFAGLENFARILTDSRFGSSLWVTVIFTLISVTAEFGIGLLLALSASSLRQWRNAVQVILLVPWTLPTAVIAVLWAWMLNDQYGGVNAVLLRSGLIHSPVTWLAEPATAMAAVVFADVWKTAPFVFLILYAGLQNIPRELYDAIEVDGGGAWARFRYVTWPHLLPFTFVALIFRIVQAFAVFDLIWVMTGGGPGGSTETLSVYTYRTYMRYLDFGYGAAHL